MIVAALALLSAIPSETAMLPMAVGTPEAANCTNATSTVDIQNCQQAALASANTALNATYQKRLAASTSAQQARLRNEERAWIRQRDQACAVKPDSGSSGSLDVGQCLIKQTEQRTQKLRAGH